MGVVNFVEFLFGECWWLKFGDVFFFFEGDGLFVFGGEYGVVVLLVVYFVVVEYYFVGFGFCDNVYCVVKVVIMMLGFGIYIFFWLV